MEHGYFLSLGKRVGVDETLKIVTEVGEFYFPKLVPRNCKLANVQLNTVLDSMKIVQLLLDGPINASFVFEDEVISPNHVVRTVRQCVTVGHLEKNAPEMIKAQCYDVEPKMHPMAFANPRIKITPKKRPPRKSPDEVFCVWEYQIEE
jgi:hypothetical protein